MSVGLLPPEISNTGDLRGMADSLSCGAVDMNMKGLYLVENLRVHGLTTGIFHAGAHQSDYDLIGLDVLSVLAKSVDCAIAVMRRRCVDDAASFHP